MQIATPSSPSDQASDEESESDESSDEEQEAQSKPDDKAARSMSRSSSTSSIKTAGDAAVDRVWQREQLEYQQVFTRQSGGSRHHVASRRWFENITDAPSSELAQPHAGHSILVPLPSALGMVGSYRSPTPASEHNLTPQLSGSGSELLGFTVTSAAVFASYGSSEESPHGELHLYTFDDDQVTMTKMEAPAIMIRCRGEHPGLHLTADSILAFILGTTRRALVDEFILFEQTRLARQLCWLNDWDRHTLNSYQLETALRFRQLENVEAVLRNIANEQVESACEMLLKTIEDANKLSKGAIFAQGLLHIAITFVSRAIQTARKQRDATQKLVPLTKLMMRMRTNLIHPRAPHVIKSGELQDNKVPEAFGVINHLPASSASDVADIKRAHADLVRLYGDFPADYKVQFELWDEMDELEVLKDAGGGSKMMMAQTYFSLLQSRAVKADQDEPPDGGDDCNNGGGPIDGSSAANGAPPLSGSWIEIQDVMLKLTFAALSRGDLDAATTVLRNLHVNGPRFLRQIYLRSTDPAVRALLAQNAGQSGLSEEDQLLAAYMNELDAMYPNHSSIACQNQRVASRGGNFACERTGRQRPRCGICHLRLGPELGAEGPRTCKRAATRSRSASDHRRSLRAFNLLPATDCTARCKVTGPRSGAQAQKPGFCSKPAISGPIRRGAPLPIRSGPSAAGISQSRTGYLTTLRNWWPTSALQICTSSPVTSRPRRIRRLQRSATAC